jgi:hypothetical protein
VQLLRVGDRLEPFLDGAVEGLFLLVFERVLGQAGELGPEGERLGALRPP